MSIKIMTDSACDLPYNYVKENGIGLVSLTVNIKGEFYKDDLGQTISYDEFYKIIRSGEITSTAQVNVYTFEEAFRKEIREGNSVIYIGLASVLSGTVNSARIARDNILEEYPDAKIQVIDSKSVTLGEGLLVYYAQEMLKEGKDYDEIVRWIEINRAKLQHAIILEDLEHLKRGGRISSTTAVVGGILGVKPSLKLDPEGNVNSGPKFKGRKRAVGYLLKELEEKSVDLENQVIFIAHADCIKDAESLKNKIIENFKVKDIIINNIGAVIGTHGGADAMAILFLGLDRE
ncbi:DegV family protein [Clostridium sp. LP20]|uniref:DegV family protein n=1 Tax=Clostridium sp. LP20 TaxID=3418665 RepID=UPI003EE48909